MTGPTPSPLVPRLRAALDAPEASSRLRTALAAGTRPDAEYAPVLLARCAVEPDLFVRDMLSWALMRHPVDVVLPLLLDEVASDVPQARSQALHTLSKLRDPRGWAAVTPELLRDPDDRVARTAWRAAVLLAPEEERPAVAEALASQLGRGDRDTWATLARALADLDGTAEGPLATAETRGDRAVRLHADAIRRYAEDPGAGFEAALFEAEHARLLADARPPTEPPATAQDGAP